MKLFSVLSAALIVTAVSGTAQAGSLTCGQFTAGPATDCKFILGDASDSAADINSLFGASWTFVDKDEAAGETDDQFFLTDDANSPSFAYQPGASTSGTYVLSSATLASANQFVLVLKGGNQAPRWAAFFLDLANLTNGTGTWSSIQGLSHATLYSRNVDNGGGDGNGGNVPEPATVALLGLGLLGAGVARRRK